MKFRRQEKIICGIIVLGVLMMLTAPLMIFGLKGTDRVVTLQEERRLAENSLRIMRIWSGAGAFLAGVGLVGGLILVFGVGPDGLASQVRGRVELVFNTVDGRELDPGTNAEALGGYRYIRFAIPGGWGAGTQV